MSSKKPYFSYIPGRKFSLSQWIGSRFHIIVLLFVFLTPYLRLNNTGAIIASGYFFLALYLLMCADINYITGKRVADAKKYIIIYLIFGLLNLFILIYLFKYMPHHVYQKDYPMLHTPTRYYMALTPVLYFCIPPIICSYHKI